MIEFKKITFKNLLSFGNDMTELDLSSGKATLIVGSNGSGKSSAILDSLTFALFGKAFRDINKSSLVNYKNGSGLIVELYFSNKNSEYKIRRGHNPNIFEIYKDGEMIEQMSNTRDYQSMLEEDILGFGYLAFTHIAVLGKANYVSFLKLKTAERRKFIESMLGLDIFATMNKLHNQSLSEQRALMIEKTMQISMKQNLIETKENYIRKLIEHSKKAIENEESDILNEIEQTKENQLNVISSIKSLETQLIPQQEDLSYLNRKSIELNKAITRIDAERANINKEIKFLSSNDSCSTCNQVIEKTFKDTKITELKDRLKEIETVKTALKDKLDKLESHIQKIDNINKINERVNQQIMSLSHKKANNQNIIARLQLKLNNVTKNTNTNIPIQDEENKLSELKEELKKDIIDKEETNSKIISLEYVSNLLKDTGVKKDILTAYIPTINEMVNEYLNKLGFFARFEIDENFNEKIIARGINDITYFNYSEGEKLRIDLAVLMTWREIAKLQNNMNCNLLIFDEIFDASLDTYGCDAFSDLLETLSGLSIFVVTHSPDKLQDRFDKVIEFEKISGFSKMKDRAK